MAVRDSGLPDGNHAARLEGPESPPVVPGDLVRLSRKNLVASFATMCPECVPEAQLEGSPVHAGQDELGRGSLTARA